MDFCKIIVYDMFGHLERNIAVSCLQRYHLSFYLCRIYIFQLVSRQSGTPDLLCKYYMFLKSILYYMYLYISVFYIICIFILYIFMCIHFEVHTPDSVKITDNVTILYTISYLFMTWRHL